MTGAVVDLREKFAGFTDQWAPKLVSRVDGMDVKLVRVEGLFDWHSHPDAEEMFLVIEGRMDVQFRDRVETLRAGQLIVVPKGVDHRPDAPEGEAKVLVIERAGVVNTGDNPESAFTQTVLEEI